MPCSTLRFYVSSEKQVQTMVSDVVRELGGLDVVRNTFPGTL